MSVRGKDQGRALEFERKAACQIMVIVRPDNSATSAECLHLPQTIHLTQCPTAVSLFLKHLTRLVRASTSPSLPNVSSHTLCTLHRRRFVPLKMKRGSCGHRRRVPASPVYARVCKIKSPRPVNATRVRWAGRAMSTSHTFRATLPAPVAYGR
jgi:hypothetical protein